MNTSLKISLNKSFSINKILRFALILVLCIYIGILVGCIALSAIPMTLKEVKDYAFGQHDTISGTHEQVLQATVYALKENGFIINRIDHFNNQRSLVQANWQNTKVESSLETITHKWTKVTNKVLRGMTTREYSSEKELFSIVRETLRQQKTLNLSDLTHGMASVHLSPDKRAPIIAYLGLNESVKLIKEEGDWGMISLRDGYSGFIALRHIRADPAGRNGSIRIFQQTKK